MLYTRLSLVAAGVVETFLAWRETPPRLPWRDNMDVVTVDPCVPPICEFVPVPVDPFCAHAAALGSPTI